MRTVMRIGNGLLTGLMLLLLTLTALLALTARRAPDGIPTILGHKLLNVLSGSMEPAIHTGDLVLVRLLGGSEPLQVGDVITYRAQESDDMLITHRVVAINPGPTYTTQGDANNVADGTSISHDQVVGKVDGRLPYFGYAIYFIHQPMGILLVVVLPGLILIAMELRKIWIELTAAERAREQAANAEGGGHGGA